VRSGQSIILTLTSAKFFFSPSDNTMQNNEECFDNIHSNIIQVLPSNDLDITNCHPEKGSPHPEGFT